jgi:transcriptional regulator with XRE-family HTH domain
MASEHSPTIRRRRLALELRRLRESARLTCEEVAEHLECSASKISRMETGRVSVSPRDVRDVLDLYRVPDEQREGLVQLARESRQKGWWHAYSDAMQPHIATYVGLESAASETRIYEVSLIPGLLQTEDYARAVIRAGMMNSPREDIERRVALRMARQPAVTRDDPLKVWAVLDEAALRRCVGGPEVMRTQLEALLGQASLPSVQIQVIPFAAGAHPGMGRPFVILVFSDLVDTDVVYLEDLASALWVEDVAEVGRYNAFFNHLRATALSFDDSRALITSVLKET